jgi:CheY-like chemotaxis protein
MPLVRIVHWKAPEAGPLIEACQACGLDVEYDDVQFGALAKIIRAKPPDAIVIDLNCLPSHGREAAIYLRRTKYARHIPLVFVDGAPEKVEIVRQQLPDATFTVSSARKQLCSRIKAACAKGVQDPVLPPGAMERYGSRTVAQKLGIREGSSVALIDPPREYAAALGVLPANVKLVEFKDAPDSVHAVALWFVRDPNAYQAAMRGIQAIAGRTKLWIVWRKRGADKAKPDGLTDNLIREAALEAGLVDYKICAVDARWSAMAFARRKS